jgi:hypothetical protein
MITGNQQSQLVRTSSTIALKKKCAYCSLVAETLNHCLVRSKGYRVHGQISEVQSNHLDELPGPDQVPSFPPQCNSPKSQCESLCDLPDRSILQLSQPWWEVKTDWLPTYPTWLGHYCPRSGSGPPCLVGHLALFWWMMPLTANLLCAKGVPVGDASPAENWSWSHVIVVSKNMPEERGWPRNASFLKRHVLLKSWDAEHNRIPWKFWKYLGK